MRYRSLTQDPRAPTRAVARAAGAVRIRPLVQTTLLALLINSAGAPASAIPTPAAAEKSLANNAMLNAANNPLTPKLTLNLHNYYMPSLYGVPGRHADQFLVQGLIPHDLLGPPQLLRFTLPIEKSPALLDGYDSGLGDLSLIDLFMFDSSGVEFGVGPMVVSPTASTSTLGSKAWQAGGAGIAVARQDWGLLMGLATFQQSFANSSRRNDVSLLTFQPLIIYNLPEGFYLRSTAIWNFSFSNNAWYMPAGLGAGHVWTIGKLTINVFGEPQYTIFHHGQAPQWQIFAGSNLQLAF